MAADQFLSESLSNGFSAVLSGIVALSTLFTILLLTLPKQYDPYEDKATRYVDEQGKEIDIHTGDGASARRWKPGRTVQIVVLGDIGRSPRMQYHALSIAKHGARVFLIGYQESEIHPDILSNSLIEIIPLVPAPASLRSSSTLLFPIVAPLKVLWQLSSLWRALGYRSRPARWMFVQNPPSIPTLAIASLMCFLRNTELVIDWHNFGYSILALKIGASHPLVKVSALYEKIFAKAAAHHITVTNAMARVLKDDYGVVAQALHDRPASLFQPINSDQRSQFLTRLPETAQYAHHLDPQSKTPWKLIVSSTSWTADEDFSLFLSALSKYSAKTITSSSSSPSPSPSSTPLPNILAIITGKGPQKSHYLAQIHQMTKDNKLANIIISTAWLTPQDYALLLASADLGVSLHTSSSGVDLPMKVVDMFGAGLPVVGWGEFQAWGELVKEDVNGKGFDSAEKLADQLVGLFGKEDKLLGQLKQGALKESENRWDDEWDHIGGKLFKLI